MAGKSQSRRKLGSKALTRSPWLQEPNRTRGTTRSSPEHGGTRTRSSNSGEARSPVDRRCQRRRWLVPGVFEGGELIPPSIWAEEVGKREKWGRRLERERGRTGSVSFPANGGGFRRNKWRSKAGREEGSIFGVRSGLGVVGNAWIGGGGTGEEEGEGGVGRERLRAKVNLPPLQNYLKAPP